MQMPEPMPQPDHTPVQDPLPNDDLPPTPPSIDEPAPLPIPAQLH